MTTPLPTALADAIKALETLSKPCTIQEFSGTIMLPELVREVNKRAKIAKEALTSLQSQAGGGGEDNNTQVSLASSDARRGEILNARECAPSAEISPPVPSPPTTGGNGQCKCRNVEFGTYKNQVTVLTPQNKMAGIDLCILPTIKSLWDAGIETIESCCGHGKGVGYIAVAAKDIPAMEALGYQHDYKSAHPPTIFKWPVPSPASGMRSAAEELFNSIKWSVALNHLPLPDAKGKLSRKVIPIIQTALDNAHAHGVSEGRARGLADARAEITLSIVNKRSLAETYDAVLALAPTGKEST